MFAGILAGMPRGARGVVPLGLLAAMVACAGCRVDRAGLPSGGGRDASTETDASRADRAVPMPDGSSDPCRCPWGCDADGCFLPPAPNLPGAQADWLTSPDPVLEVSSNAVLRTSGEHAGRIRTANGRTLRQAGMGTDAQTGIRFETLAQGGDEVSGLAVLSMGSLQVTDGARFEIRGERSVVLLARADVLLEGVLDVSADGIRPGPGGYGPAEGGPGAGKDGLSGAEDGHPGGGGAGFGARGGTGGSSMDALGGQGGTTYDDGSLEPLLGGSAAGQGPEVGAEGPLGGAGGGAVQIVAGTVIHLNDSAPVDDAAVGIRAAGGGGRSAAGVGAGGGGSGGAVLLMAPRIRMDAGVVAANGGSGAGLFNGLDGELSADRVEGGQGGSDVGAGGAGGAGRQTAGTGAESGPEGGGGGGAAGRIRVRTRTGELQGTGGTWSPGMETGALQIEAVEEP